MTIEEFSLATAKLGLSFTEEQIQKFLRYAALLKEWNEKINLTSIVEEAEVLEKHFYDCLLPLEAIDLNGKKLADMGSGAGFPGMVFALACPECEVTLIDSTAKKFKFLEAVKEELQIQNVHFYVGRVEEIKKERASFDVVSARGFASLRVLSEVGAPLLKVNGTLLAMKSQRGEEEMAEAKNTLRILGLSLKKEQTSSLPNGDVRLNYFFVKTKPTSPRYPRRWAEIQAKPL